MSQPESPRLRHSPQTGALCCSAVVDCFVSRMTRLRTRPCRTIPLTVSGLRCLGSMLARCGHGRAALNATFCHTRTIGKGCNAEVSRSRQGMGVVNVADRSSIEWTEATWNPTTGCDRISSGCDNCYALTLAKRLKAMGAPKYQSDGDPRTSGPGFALTVHPDSLMLPYKWKSPRVVFVNSMSDLFHARVPRSFIRSVFDVMADTPQHTYQILTKRSRRLLRISRELPWPANVWMGVSVEDSTNFSRIDDLRATGAAVKFLSCEPLIGPIAGIELTGIDWVIGGGESGSRCRHLDPSWIRHLRDECLRADIPFFFKQWGGRTPKAGGRILDGRTWDDLPRKTRVNVS